MYLSRTELKILEQVSRGNNKVVSIAEALKRDKSQIYRTAQKMQLVSLKEGILIPADSTHVAILLQLLAFNPSIIDSFSNCGIELFSTILEPRSISEIVSKTGVKSSMAYHKLQQAKRINLMNIIEKKYFLNERIWPKAKEFLIELKKYEEAKDRRTPPGAIIYYKTNKEIVFSCKEEFDAAPTAFSAFEKYGIRLLSPFNYYYLPKLPLTKQDVFEHALLVAEQENKVSGYLYLSLFYLKHRHTLPKTKNRIIESIKQVLNGIRVQGYPSLAEIKEKAEMYGVIF